MLRHTYRRRDVLLGLAAAAAFPAHAAAEQSKPGRGEAGLIDLHHHVFPPEFLEVAISGYVAQNQKVVAAWTPQNAVASMDAHGVATAIASIT